MSLDRCCVICDSKNSELLSGEELDVAGLGKIEIGVSICKKCGCIFQNPCVPKVMMNKFYEQFSNYTNVATDFKPSEERIRIIEKQVKFCLDNIDNKGLLDKTLFQIGCSDGYTLSVFKELNWKVTGIEPSETCRKLAKSNYDIDIFTGFFENFENEKKYDLIVLTHVLEHIYEPKLTVLKTREFLNDGGYVFIEVPLLAFPDLWPNGFFSFEHIQFFSEKNLNWMLHQCGYKIINKRYFFHQYPIISFVCKKINLPSNLPLIDEFNESKIIVKKFLKREQATWKKIGVTINRQIYSSNRIFIWGGGIHTSKFLFCTKLEKNLEITNIVDNDPQKSGLKLANIEIINPKNVQFTKGDVIVISSHSSEQQIYESIKNLEDLGIKIIKMYT